MEILGPIIGLLTAVVGLVTAVVKKSTRKRIIIRDGRKAEVDVNKEGEWPSWRPLALKFAIALVVFCAGWLSIAVFARLTADSVQIDCDDPIRIQRGTSIPVKFTINRNGKPTSPGWYPPGRLELELNGFEGSDHEGDLRWEGSYAFHRNPTHVIAPKTTVVYYRLYAGPKLKEGEYKLVVRCKGFDSTVIRVQVE